MTKIESLVREHALRRLASIFLMESVALVPSARFGEELKARPRSLLKDNEFDLIEYDIKDVADKSLLREMARGELEIKTVSDYCDHMVRCYAIKPTEVARLLSLPPFGDVGRVPDQQ